MAAIKKVSEELSNALSLRLAVLILMLVIVVPFLNFSPTDYSPNAWITNLKIQAKNDTITNAEMANLNRKLEHFFTPKTTNLLSVYVESPWIEPYERYFGALHNVRDKNRITYNSSYFVANSTLSSSANPIALQYLNQSIVQGRNSRYGFTEFVVELQFDYTNQNKQQALYNILIILLVIFALFGFAALFNQAVNTLVIKPLEKLLGTLRSSAIVMIKSLKSLEAAHNVEEKKNDSVSAGEEEDEGELETAKLELMVEKLARIISHIVPGANDITIDGNIDGNTAHWLKAAYSDGAGARREVFRIESVMAHEGAADRTLLRRLESTMSADTLTSINSWDFDVLRYSEEELTSVMVLLFSRLNLLEEFSVPETTFRFFLKEIFGRYIDNTYHNFRHGCDVCFTSYRLVVIPQLTAIFTPLEVFSLLVGALSHDVGHIGVNNAYLVKTKHELALRYNDKSPLENMHCNLLYEVLSKEESNIFKGLSQSQWRESRKIIIFIILGTDMVNHPQQIKDTKVSYIVLLFSYTIRSRLMRFLLQLFLEVNGDDAKAFCCGERDDIPALAVEKERHAILELMLHCSDISNPFKPYDLCAKWADLVVEEFFQQGDQERTGGLEISPMCDRNQVNLCNMQMGFIEFAVAPLITS